jgi:hypothetical protein
VLSSFGKYIAIRGDASVINVRTAGQVDEKRPNHRSGGWSAAHLDLAGAIVGVPESKLHTVRLRQRLAG